MLSPLVEESHSFWISQLDSPWGDSIVMPINRNEVNSDFEPIEAKLLETKFKIQLFEAKAW